MSKTGATAVPKARILGFTQPRMCPLLTHGVKLTTIPDCDAYAAGWLAGCFVYRRTPS